MIFFILQMLSHQSGNTRQIFGNTNRPFPLELILCFNDTAFRVNLANVTQRVNKS